MQNVQNNSILLLLIAEFDHLHRSSMLLVKFRKALQTVRRNVGLMWPCYEVQRDFVIVLYSGGNNSIY